MENFEFGKIEDTIELITTDDLMVEVSGAINYRMPLGSHLALVEFLGSLLGSRLIFKTCSGSPLYVVKWHDLTEKKKAKIKGVIR